MIDLWPNDLATVTTRSPLTILKEQASLLGAKTNNIVKANVRDASAYKGVVKPFNYNFVITSPALGNYTYRLFTISYDIDLYPVEFIVDDAIALEMEVGQHGAPYGPRDELIARREEEFIKILSRILGSEKTRQVIRAILSHSTDQSLDVEGTPD
jgi:hypothetical protein